MNTDEVKPRHFIIAFLLLVVAAIVPGLFYWSASGAEWAKCIYGNAGCSEAVGTHLLAAVALATLLTAGYAASYAKRTFDLEREVIVSIHSCNVDEDQHNAYRREEWHLRSLSEKTPFTPGPPLENEDDYEPVDFDCCSLGRSAVINGVLLIACKLTDGTKKQVSIRIGSIPASAFCHMRLWLSDDVKKVRFEWRYAIHREGQGRGRPVRIDMHTSEREFGRPIKKQVGDVDVSGIDKDRPELEGLMLEEKPAPPEKPAPQKGDG